MVQAKNWIRQHNEAGFLLYWIFYLTAFSALEVLVLPQHPLICALDERIPFCAWFAVPYFSWFPALALSQGYYLIRDRAGFQNLCFLMFSGMTVALAVYVIYPISIDVRVPLEGGGVLHRLVALLQGFDSPRNVCPSIHVSSSLAIAAAVQMDPRLVGRGGNQSGRLALDAADLRFDGVHQAALDRGCILGRGGDGRADLGDLPL